MYAWVSPLCSLSDILAFPTPSFLDLWFNKVNLSTVPPTSDLEVSSFSAYYSMASLNVPMHQRTRSSTPTKAVILVSPSGSFSSFAVTQRILIGWRPLARNSLQTALLKCAEGWSLANKLVSIPFLLMLESLSLTLPAILSFGIVFEQLPRSQAYAKSF